MTERLHPSVLHLGEGTLIEKRTCIENGLISKIEKLLTPNCKTHVLTMDVFG